MIRFTIMPDGVEPFDVVASTRDIARWEKVTKGASFAALENDKKVSDLYKIAFHASVRQGFWTGTLAEFEQDVDLDFPEDDEDGEADPTRSAA